MRSHTVKAAIKITLELDEQEAIQLKDLVQNASSDDEPKEIKDLRRELFHHLSEALDK